MLFFNGITKGLSEIRKIDLCPPLQKKKTKKFFSNNPQSIWFSLHENASPNRRDLNYFVVAEANFEIQRRRYCHCYYS